MTQKDSSGSPLVTNRLYQDSDGNFYQSFSKEGELKLLGHDKEVYTPGIPQSMPDSSRMPEGQVNASELRLISRSELQGYLNQQTQSAKQAAKTAQEERQKLRFLERVKSGE